MSLFSAMDIGRTGLGFSHYWMDTIAHNIANVNTVRPTDQDPFRAIDVVAQPLGSEPYAPTGSGVGVREILRDDAPAPLTYDPDNPLADADGMVQQPAVDLAREMSNLIVANRSYQANLRTVETAREAYQSALRLGQR